MTTTGMILSAGAAWVGGGLVFLQGICSNLGPAVTANSRAVVGDLLLLRPAALVAAGGVLVEYFSDRQFAIAPVTKEHASAMIEALPIAKLLDGVRGAPPCDKDAVAAAFSAFSIMCSSLGGAIAEVDVNPVIASPKGAIAVDGLIIPSKAEGVPQ